MSPLRASWLGSWAAPWGPRGRRWGDATWALGAVSQAWLMGGREGRWPQGDWLPGPRPAAWPVQDIPCPDPAWVAMLRHGSPGADARRRGPKEGELEAWAWAELLEGCADAWWARAPLLLSLEERIRWIPWLGALDTSGALQLPPFLAMLLPEAQLQLPEGWWECLLRDLDTQGRLLPSGTLPPGLPWELLTAEEARLLDPWVLGTLPPSLHPFREASWLQALPGSGWMIDPRIRAWGRGSGLPPAPPGLAFGGAAHPAVASLLQAKCPEHPWARAIQDDLEARTPSELPPLCGEPTLDRLRMRWGGEAAAPAPGYPLWGTPSHPCADPFHWMAEGRQAFFSQDLERALRAFTLAHAHFQRLESPFWATRAAANASYAALFWGDLHGLRSWQKSTGPQPSPFREYDEALLLACSAQWEVALPILRRLNRSHPDFGPAWVLLATHGLAANARESAEEALPHLPPGSLRILIGAFLAGDFTLPLPDLEAEERLQWEYLRVRHGEGTLPVFWEAWGGCTNHLLRLETGLLILEEHPSQRSAGNLLQLETIAGRSASGSHMERLQRLWPIPVPGGPRSGRELLEAWLGAQGRPTWVLWGKERLGCGVAPPEALLEHLRREGAVAPCALEGRIWWGIPLHWEGARVGSALVGLSPEDSPTEALAVEVISPWVAQLLPPHLAMEAPHSEGLLSDGSEPMASVLREMGRVAPSGLTVLILGPSGSGKELAAGELHRLSGRKGPLVPVNCSAFAESLLESELFGHVKGAFTGAERDRRGAIEQAEGGTLFLDEIADLSPRLQSLFLRVLQEKELRRVGSERVQRVDVRFLAATHRNLEHLTQEGHFRQDLLYRLQGAVLRLPDLHSRRHELPYLLPRLLARIAREGGTAAPPLGPGVAQALARHPWPGNFRELQHALARALLRCGEGPLRLDHFPELGTRGAKLRRSWAESTQEFQRQLLRESLHHHHFQVSETASSLGITRPALYATAKRVGLDLITEKQRWEETRS